MQESAQGRGLAWVEGKEGDLLEINARSRLIHDQNLALFQQSSSQTQQLFLTSAKIRPFDSNERIQIGEWVFLQSRIVQVFWEKVDPAQGFVYLIVVFRSAKVLLFPYGTRESCATYPFAW